MGQLRKCNFCSDVFQGLKHFFYFWIETFFRRASRFGSSAWQRWISFSLKVHAWFTVWLNLNLRVLGLHIHPALNFYLPFLKSQGADSIVTLSDLTLLAPLESLALANSTMPHIPASLAQKVTSSVISFFLFASLHITWCSDAFSFHMASLLIATKL